MATRYRDWLNQAERDLEQASDSREAGRHEWAYFAAHQAAEKAAKALHDYLGQEAWGHVVARLLAELGPTVLVPEELLDKARVLDTYYVPTRYPNAHTEGAPFERYGGLQSREAVQYASEVLSFVRTEVAQRQDRP